MTDLDAQVRAADPDRWLSSRFVADPAARADLMALYAFEAELDAIPGRVSQPLLAEMRLTWWAEQMNGVFAGAPRKGHPVLEALAGAVGRHALPRAPFDARIEAAIQIAHKQAPDMEALYAGPMRLAARILTGADEDAAGAAAPAWAAARAGDVEASKAARGPANRVLKALPAAAFPAVAHATLARAGAPEPLKRLKLVWAVARGRI